MSSFFTSSSSGSCSTSSCSSCSCTSSCSSSSNNLLLFSTGQITFHQLLFQMQLHLFNWKNSEDTIIRIKRGIQNNPRWECIGQVTNSIRSLRTNKTWINKKFKWIFFIVADNLKCISFELKFRSLLEVRIFCNMRDLNWN